MGKSIAGRYEDSRKWLKKNDEVGLNLKPALAALAAAEKATEELGKAKSRVLEMTTARKAAVEALALAMNRAKTEKRLKAKELRLQARLAALAAPAAASK